MNTDFLTRLWWACSSEGSGPFREGLNLSELYEHTEETQKTQRSFYEVMESAGLTQEQINQIDDASTDMLNTAELQGFINGWWLCKMLQNELCKNKRS